MIGEDAYGVEKFIGLVAVHVGDLQGGFGLDFTVVFVRGTVYTTMMLAIIGLIARSLLGQGVLECDL